MRPALDLSLAALVFYAVSALACTASADSAPVWFMHASDPQIGYGDSGRAEDGARFERLLALAAEKKPSFVVVTGDLVQDRTILQWWTFERARASARLPVYYVAGNHDVVDLDSLASYRERLGPDYYAKTQDGITLVVIDSETARDTRISSDESTRQWQWLERTLTEKKCGDGALCVVAMHRPPYAYEPNEPESDANWPPSTRTRLLELLARHDVTTILAGHLHQTRAIHDPQSKLAIYSVGGTARVFDDQGAGYRAFTLEAGALTQRYVPFEQISKQADFMGVAGWTPRLFRPSLRHWLLTLGECAVGVLAFMTAAAWARRRQAAPKSSAVLLWRVIGAAFVFFGLNEQLDLDELALGLLRQLSRAQGWNPLRHQVGAVVAAGFVLGLIACGAWLLFRAGAARRTALLALVGLAFPASWFVLSTLSDHGFSMIFSVDTWDLMLFAALAFSVFATRRGLHVARAAPVSRSPSLSS